MNKIDLSNAPREMLMAKAVIELQINVERLSSIVKGILDLPNINNHKTDQIIYAKIQANETIPVLEEQLAILDEMIAAHGKTEEEAEQIRKNLQERLSKL